MVRVTSAFEMTDIESQLWLLYLAPQEFFFFFSFLFIDVPTSVKNSLIDRLMDFFIGWLYGFYSFFLLSFGIIWIKNAKYGPKRWYRQSAEKLTRGASEKGIQKLSKPVQSNAMQCIVMQSSSALPPVSSQSSSSPRFLRLGLPEVPFAVPRSGKPHIQSSIGSSGYVPA